VSLLTPTPICKCRYLTEALSGLAGGNELVARLRSREPWLKIPPTVPSCSVGSATLGGSKLEPLDARGGIIERIFIH